ncbi:MAG: phosphoserine phosphatase [Myxococcota bacterium]
MSWTIGAATRPAAGETVSGDCYVTRTLDGADLLVVVDALGHGPNAHEVANRAEEVVASLQPANDAEAVMMQLHRGLRSSRGAAAVVVHHKGGTVSTCGVGNVDLRSQPSQVSLLPSPGILGGTVRRMRTLSVEIEAQIRLYVFSDGIESRFSIDSFVDSEPQNAAEEILERHGRDYDDATIVIADVDFSG